MTMNGILSVMLLIGTETCYLAFHLITFFKFKHLKNVLLLVTKIIQSSFLLAFLVICLKLGLAKDTGNSKVDPQIQKIGKIVIIIAMLLETIGALTLTILSLVNIFKDAKLRKVLKAELLITKDLARKHQIT